VADFSGVDVGVEGGEGSLGVGLALEWGVEDDTVEVWFFWGASRDI